MLKEFKQFIALEKLFSQKEKILLAVSGGMDSVVMTELFHLAGFNYGIAHCNFQLRGEDSEQDEKFVADLAGRYKAPFYSKRFPTLQTAAKKGISIQMAARELRYEWFREILTDENYNYVATAHHLDDQAETLFINMMRSTGIAGFHGILPKHGNLIRPMMFTNRSTIENFVKDYSISFREDKSNNETKYLRNKIRHEIFPVLREIDPGFTEHLTENINRIREVESIFREAVEMKRKKVVRKEKNRTTILISKINKLDSPETFLYEFLSPFGFNISQVNDLLKIAGRTSGKTMLSPTNRLVLDRHKIIILSKKYLTEEEKTKQEFEIIEATKTIRKPIRLTFQKQIKDKDFMIDPSRLVAFFDFKKITFPLQLRKWKRGDRFYPFGRNQGKKLSDFFIDEKISIPDKENTWLLCSSDAILWIIGHRTDNRFRVTTATKEVLKITLTK